jgi:hypothetical protein
MEIGKTYQIRHRRKGTFVAEITEQDSEWTTGIIVSGATAVMLRENGKETGESVTFRTEFVIKATEVKQEILQK